MRNIFQSIIILITITSCHLSQGQNTPDFTQYIYNTMSVNPAYTGSKGYWSVLGMHRSQWVGINGSPTTQNLSIEGPVGKTVGLGVNIVNDALGPVNELFINTNFSYTIKIDRDGRKLSFGLKGGGRIFNVDFTKGIIENQDIAFQTNIENKFFPTIGAGMYYYSPKSYFGVSIPNFFSQEFYDTSIQELTVERLHFFFIGGSTIDLNKNVKIIPTFFIKKLQDKPMIADIAMNSLIKETLTLGIAYRFNDSFSTLIGIQLNPRLHVGYAYDVTSRKLKTHNFGTHEIFLRFEFKSQKQAFETSRPF